MMKYLYLAVVVGICVSLLTLFIHGLYYGVTGREWSTEIQLLVISVLTAWTVLGSMLTDSPLGRSVVTNRKLRSILSMDAYDQAVARSMSRTHGRMERAGKRARAKYQSRRRKRK